MRRLVRLAFPLLALSGCNDIQEYPSNWAKPTVAFSSECSDLVGSYYELDSGGSQIGLVHILSGYAREPKENADHVQLTMSERGTLNIVAIHEKTVITEYKFTEQGSSLSCSPVGAVITISNGRLANQGVLGYSKISARLSKDKEGYLVVRREESSIGAYAIIPIVGKSGKWYRFRPYPSEGNSRLTN